MENKKCPYCNSELTEGKLYGDRYKMKWMPLKDKLVMGIWAKKDYISVGVSYFIGRPQAPADYCKHCHKIFIDLNEQ